MGRGDGTERGAGCPPSGPAAGRSTTSRRSPVLPMWAVAGRAGRCARGTSEAARARLAATRPQAWRTRRRVLRAAAPRSEEHTSELQSHHDLVCRLLLEKKKKKT